MIDTPVPTRFGESDFRISRVLDRTWAVLSRNFLPFFSVTAVAYVPTLLLFKGVALWLAAGGALRQLRGLC
jgi:hypothetical protein